MAVCTLTLNIRGISFLLTGIKSEGQTELTESAPSLKEKRDTGSEQNHLKVSKTINKHNPQF